MISRSVRAINGEEMRRQNLAAVLNIIRQKRQISRVALAQASGVSSATISRLVGDLIDQHIVR